MPADDRRLKLPPSIEPLFGALERDDIDVLNRAGARLGGGTVLAARWNHHRRSTDLDFFVPITRFEALKPLLVGLLGRIEARLLSSEMPNAPDADNLLQLNTAVGAIDLVGMDDLTTSGRHWRNSEEWIAQGRHGPLRTLNTGAILQAKLENRSLRLHERDVYDVAYAARHHPDDLAEALARTSRRILAAYAHQLETMPTIPTTTEKPVLDPTWTHWRTEAGPEIVRAIDDFDARTVHASNFKGPQR